MGKRNINRVQTESAAETVSRSAAKNVEEHKMTKEEAKQKTDAELLQMVKDAKGHTTSDSSDYMKCDFSYSYLTSLLSDRGYENGWHKVSDAKATFQEPVIIQMKKSDDEMVRQSYMMGKKTAEKWKEFNKDIPYKTVTIDAALLRFMDDVYSGRVKFEFKI